MKVQVQNLKNIVEPHEIFALELMVCGYHGWLTSSQFFSLNLEQDDGFSATTPFRVIGIYGEFLSNRKSSGYQVSEKGVLQILLDLRFAVDVLSGGDSNMSEEVTKSPVPKFSYRRKQDQSHTKSVIKGSIDGLVNSLSQRLNPIDWLTFEPYLWENERRTYLRHAVLFGFFVQLNRLYTDIVQEPSTNSKSNVMRCSVVPRFKYLCISAPALSSRGTTKTSLPICSDDISSTSSWKAYTNGDLSQKIAGDDNSSFGIAAPFFKSFMQVGSRFGESTLKLGSMLTDGQLTYSRIDQMLQC